MSVFIYSLHDPETGHLRYVGKANNPIKRLRNHLSRRGLKKSHRDSWIQNLKSRGLKPIQFIVAEVPEVGWQFQEQKFIRGARDLGFDLVNETEGGEGLVNPSSATREKMRASHIGKIPWNKGKLCPIIGSVRKGMIFSESHRKALSDAAKTNPIRMKHIDSLNRIGKKDSEETRKKKSESARTAWQKRRGVLCSL